jgi:flagellar hook-associated protein 3 FlgL
MVSGLSGAVQQYLSGLDQIQSRLNTVQEQLSSGYRVNQASDDPVAVPDILGTIAKMSQVTQTQSNLNQAKTELSSGDTALQNAITLVEQAISLGTQAASTISKPDSTTLAAQVQSIQQQLVALSNTQVNGRYIFSGDLDQQALYSYSAATGITQLTTATSTRAVTDGQGDTLWVAPTAQQIFDPQTNGAPASGNVFAAVQSLLTAIQGQSTTDAATAVDSLKQAGDYLNQQLGLYGIAENRVSTALSSATSAQSSLTQQLSGLRDTDVASAAIELSQIDTQQQAALAAGAKLSQLSLFNYLG